MRVRYTATALAEINEIISYIGRDNPRAAGEVAAAMSEDDCERCPETSHWTGRA
jgi:plasmid stabilization system protein ParE